MDYSETLCLSIDNIVLKRIKQIQFNSIKSYRVSEVVDAANGKYILSDGNESSGTSFTFTAYTFDGVSAYYEVGDWVYVLIPNNDFSENKFILSMKHMEA